MAQFTPENSTYTANIIIKIVNYVQMLIGDEILRDIMQIQ